MTTVAAVTSLPTAAEVRHKVHERLVRERGDDLRHVWVRGRPHQGDNKDPPPAIRALAAGAVVGSLEYLIVDCMSCRGQFVVFQDRREYLSTGRCVHQSLSILHVRACCGW